MSIINTKVPHFNADAFHENKFIKIDSHNIDKQWCVFFFYPANFTFVCPTELGDLARSYAQFKELNCEIYSVSKDTHFSHKVWHEISPIVNRVKFPMIGDPSGNIISSFGVMNNSGSGLALRATFIADSNLKIVMSEVSDNAVGRNAKDLLRKIQACQFSSEKKVLCPASWNGDDQDTISPAIELVGKI